MSMKPEIEKTAGQWNFVLCECYVGKSGGTCRACGYSNLRFLYVLEHPVTLEILFVGVECAAVLMRPEHSHIPRLAENEAKRNERWRLRYDNPGRITVTVDDLEKRGKI